ncbi:hypothetical protein B0H11DRAFT_2244041 [Mycena galericulata]|nr:hypothetical protein B0H11DRAFT_2244041 [Mycena galericulata]
MGRRTKRQAFANRHLNHSEPDSETDDENITPGDSEVPKLIPDNKPKTLRVQLIEKDAQITELERSMSVLREDLRHQRGSVKSLDTDNKNLRHRNDVLFLTNKSLQTLKRKAESNLMDELTKKHKRVKRLERDRDTKNSKNINALSSLNDDLIQKTNEIHQLRQDLESAMSCLRSRDITITSLETALQQKQSTLKETRSKLYAALKRADRTKQSLEKIQKAYKELKTWDPMKHGIYSDASRELARKLTFSGCSADKVAFVVESCASTFGVYIRRPFMSRRTVGRAIDEGGKFGEIQLAREIIESPGFVESSDGTTDRGITVESRHITLLAPSYEPGVDDSDKSTWKHQTRFLEVAPALDHTGQRQFEGTMEAANRIADIYTRSPLAVREKRAMDKNTYWRKKLGESKDHAADGKKEFKLSAAHKKNIILQDMGRATMDEADVATSYILLAVSKITDDELQAAGKLSATELAALPTEQRSKLVEEVLEQKIGAERFDSLTAAEQKNACTHVFGGCCCHKDLNLLLANKANSAIIDVSKDPDDTALQKAMEASARGGVKLLELIGALLRHKDGERGYQDKCSLFMRERKLEVFDLEAPGKFPDVSNTRYGCHSYAAAEVICFPGLIQELITEIIDGKTKSGQPNHVEKNILKGLNCTATITELAALALYGMSVSWPYMAMVRGTKENPINLLSLTDLHRRLPAFCSHVAANPHMLLDPKTPPEQLTIDGRPFQDEILLHSILQMRGELPNLLLITSNLFAGCAEGWIQFTPEFHVGGTFDQLTPEQRAILFIPSTNDCNEGMLGSYRVHMRYHPNSTAHSFSNQTRAERNNTEAFIKKFCDDAVQRFVMREVRRDGANGARAKFRKAFLTLQREKAEKALKRRKKTETRKKLAETRLKETTLELDTSKIKALSSPQLKDQLRVYRDVLKDEILMKKLWKEMDKVGERRTLVLAARDRELARRCSRDAESPGITNENTELTVIVEYGYSPDEDAEWEDIIE